MSYTEEFIGKTIKVVRAKNKSLEGIEGIIVDETKNTFKILKKKKSKKNEQEEKTVLKKGTVLIINNQTINGNEISKRPEERIKTNK